MQKQTSKNIATNAILGLYCVVVILFSYQEGSTHYAKIFPFIMMIFYLYFLIEKNQKITIDLPYKYLMVWFFIALLSSVAAINNSLALKKLISMATLLGTSFIVYSLLLIINKTKIFQLFLLLATVLSSCVVLLNVGKYSYPDGRVFGTMANANMYAYLLTISISISFSMVLFEKNWIYKGISIITICIAMYMMIKTGSRKGMVGMVVGPSLIYFLWAQTAIKYQKAKVFRYGLISLLALFAIVGYIASGEHYDRMETFISGVTTGNVGKDDRSVEGRIELYDLAFKSAVDNLVLGVGPDNFREVKTGGRFSTAIGTYAHSNYMEVLVTTGLFGFMSYYAVYAIVLYRFIMLRRCVIYTDLVQRYTSAFTIVILITLFDFAMVSYAAKLTWIIFPWIYAELHLIRREVFIKRTTV